MSRMQTSELAHVEDLALAALHAARNVRRQRSSFTGIDMVIGVGLIAGLEAAAMMMLLGRTKVTALFAWIF